MVRDSSSGLSCVLAAGAETIVARATAEGRGALAIVRLSGSRVREIAERVCGWTGWSDVWQTALVVVRSAAGEKIDRAVLIAYPEPRSYTGEDMVELVIHGSPYVSDEVVASCVEAGARPAGGGEFSRRAVANGKMDLAQAEGVRDLIAAETLWQARNARLQADGRLSATIASLRGHLVRALALIEGSLDFIGQELVVEEERVEGAVESALRMVDELCRSAILGRRLREGVRVAILGRPNAGKSTLFNALVGWQRAIVAASPGTTRDVVETVTEIGGMRAVLMDTAGLRAVDDVVEAEGVKRARQAAADADVVVLVWGSDEPQPPPEWEGAAKVIRVQSKCDLGGKPAVGWWRVSCVSGEGVEELRSALRDELCAGVDGLGTAVAIGARHRNALERAAGYLTAMPRSEPELMAEHLRWALDAVGEIIGSVASEEVLDEVFSTFCLGK